MEKIYVLFDGGIDEGIKRFYRESLSVYAEIDEGANPSGRSLILGPSASRILFDPVSLLGLDEDVQICSYRAEDDTTLREDIFFSMQKGSTAKARLCALSQKKHSVTNLCKRACLFLDRDGIIIKDTGYPAWPQEPSLIDTIVPAISYANSRSVPVVVATNQSGVGRGYFSKEALSDYTDIIADKLAKRGCRIDHWHFCPFHEEAVLPRYRRESPSRKPAPGMVLRTFGYFPVDICRSLMIGDRPSDRIDLPSLESHILPQNLDGIDPGEILTLLKKRGL